VGRNHSERWRLFPEVRNCAPRDDSSGADEHSRRVGRSFPLNQDASANFPCMYCLGLMLGRTLLFAFGKHLTGRISAGISHDATNASRRRSCCLRATRRRVRRLFWRWHRHHESCHARCAGMTDIHAMNKLKVILGGVINGVATLTFVATRVHRLAPSHSYDRGLLAGRLFRRALCAKAPASLGEVLRHRGRNGHDHLFFHSRLPLSNLHKS